MGRNPAKLRKNNFPKFCFKRISTESEDFLQYFFVFFDGLTERLYWRPFAGDEKRTAELMKSVGRGRRIAF